MKIGAPVRKKKMSSDFEIANPTASASGPSAAAGLNHQWSVVTDHCLHSSGAGAVTSEHRNRRRSQRCCCARCWTAGCTWLTSAVGVSFLLVVYLMTGAIMFMILGNEEAVSTKTTSTRGDSDGRLLDKTMATVDRLWSITEDLNILYRDNWTHLARVEMRHYQDQIVRTLRQMMLEERYSFRQTWTFPMSLLYALTLITTIGYGFYTPSTLLARSLTTAYSLLGIPLFLLYLSVVGERLARVINRMTCSCCCCCCDGSGDEGISGRPGRRRLGAYRQYSDVTLALQPMAFHAEGNGHVSQLELAGSGTPQPPAFLKNGVCCCGSPADTTQVPLLVCAGLLAVFIGLASLLLVLFEPQLGFVDSLHLTINLLMTLGFAGNLLPGMSAEDGDKDGRLGSQLSLILVACLILLGTTLLSSSFNVLMDSINHKTGGSGGGESAGTTTTRSGTTYHHMSSPSRQHS